MKKIAIVTGASSGIGEAFVRLLSEGGKYDEIWAVARRESRLRSLSAILEGGRVRPVVADLTSSSGILSIASLLESSGASVALLCNCAGVGRRGNVESNTESEIAATLNTNCTALSLVTRTVLPYMGEGAIVNIASSAGFLPQPGFAVYAASKAYVIDFSRALAYELAGSGVTVTCVCPGPVESEFLGKATGGAEAEFTGFRKHFVTTPQRLAEVALRSASRGRKMCVYPFSQKLLHLASKILPVNLILFFETKCMSNN